LKLDKQNPEFQLGKCVNDATLFKNCVNVLAKKVQSLCSCENAFHNVKKRTMKNNQESQSDIQNTIKWRPLSNAAQIGVTIKDGLVSLTALVHSYIIDAK
jgi:hypothetical protein